MDWATPTLRHALAQTASALMYSLAQANTLSINILHSLTPHIAGELKHIVMHPTLKAMGAVKYGIHLQGDKQTMKTRLSPEKGQVILNNMKKWKSQMMVYITKQSYVMIAIIAPPTSEIWDAYLLAELKAKKPQPMVQLTIF